MDTLQAFIVIGVAALIHASFQLSVSVLTLLSSHTLGKKRSRLALARLTGGFILGAGVMTLLLLSSTSLIALNLIYGQGVPPIIWAGISGLLIGIGISVWLFYYRKGPATELWLPRGLAQFLEGRVKATKLSAESFGLGLSSVIAEIIFVGAPILVASLTLLRLDIPWQLAGLSLYTLVSLLPLLIVGGLVGSGHSIAKIQKWRIRNKRFLQFTGGAGLIVLGFYLYVDQITVILTQTGA